MLGFHWHQENYFDFQLVYIRDPNWTSLSKYTMNWKTSLCLLPSLWGADNPQAPQKSWDCSVFLWLETLCSLPPASLACFTLKSISTKVATGTPRPQKQQQMWNPEVKDQHNCKNRVNKNGIISISANGREGVTKWTGLKSTFPRVF